MVSPKNGSSASHAISKLRSVAALDDGLRQSPALSSQRGHLAEHEIDFSLTDKRHHLVDAVGRGAKLAAAMQKREVSCQRRQVQRPIQRGVSAADDQKALVAKRFQLANGIKNGRILIGFDARNGRALGLERAATGRDHDDLDLEDLAAIGRHAEQRIADPFDCLDHFLQVKRRPERLDLRHQRVADALSGDVWNSGNVIDRLFRIKFGALAADLVEDVDDVRLHVEQAELEYRKQSARSRANDEHVGLDGFCHEPHALPIQA